MASADFSPFVVTHGFHIVPCGYTLFPSADETSLGTTRHFLSIYLPHLLQLIPSSYGTLTCVAALSLTITSCDFCSSDQRFAIRLPSDSTLRWIPLSLAVSFPLLGRIWDFHPLATGAARRTAKEDCQFILAALLLILRLFTFYIPYPSRNAFLFNSTVLGGTVFSITSSHCSFAKSMCFAAAPRTMTLNALLFPSSIAFFSASTA